MNRLKFRFARWLLLVFLLAQSIGSGAVQASPNAIAQQLSRLSPNVQQAASTKGPIDNHMDVAQAVVRIRVKGTSVSWDGGDATGAWGGTGFIIDPSGIIVTNNHVVAGASTISVYVLGEETPYSARVLGTNECADLAVIEIDGKDLPYLAWYEEEVQQGLQVYAIGYPGIDEGTESTMTRGIVEKVHANGQTNWASLDYVIQHGATINPGNSGGPLVDEGGQVIGVNYAGNQQANQYFAISRELALPIIKQLRQGIDLDSIGVNGEAVSDGKGNSGVWVYSVRSGSPADRAGIQAGDLIVKMENLPVGVDGILKDYCDILRNHRLTDVIAITVWRDQTILTGQLNGRDLTPIDLSTPTPVSTSTPEPTATPSAPPPYHLVATSNNIGNDVIHAILPQEWSDREVGDWEDNGKIIGRTFSASSDLQSWQTGWSTPGVRFFIETGVFNTIDINRFLDGIDLSKNCTRGKRNEYKHSINGYTYVGAYDIWASCDGVKNVFIKLIVVSQPADQLIIINFNGVSEADPEAWHQLLNSFYVEHKPSIIFHLPTPLPATATPLPPQPAQVYAIVQAAILNIRSGPGTNYRAIDQVEQGKQLTVIGQTWGCAWLKVQLSPFQVGWVSGAAQFVSLSTSCFNIPYINFPIPTPTRFTPQKSGCVVIRNNLNTELTITLTSSDGKWNTVFKAGPKATVQKCFTPDKYTYTIDAPPPFGSQNGTFDFTTNGYIDKSVNASDLGM